MEFWGVEVKPGQPLVVNPGHFKYLHLSQAALGETKKSKANESVTVFFKIGGQKLVLGILSPENFPNLSFDLVFTKEFELSHNWKNGSVYLCGYQTYWEDQEPGRHLGKPSHEAEKKSIADKANSLKPETSKKPNIKLAEPSKEDDDNESDDDDESYEVESEEDMLGTDSSDFDTDEEDDVTEGDVETPKKVEPAKKRLNESASKTQVPAKKTKLTSPKRTDGKKGERTGTATPHPAKKLVKPPGQPPKKETRQFSCMSCDRSFGSDNALKSHNKAKHHSN